MRNKIIFDIEWQYPFLHELGVFKSIEIRIVKVEIKILVEDADAAGRT